MINKRGELTSNQLITIIILIISFAIIVAFFFMLGLKSTIDKETCRNSVITRGSLPFGKDVVSLKCKTQDICLSLGGECDIQRKDMVIIKVINENELVKEMVNQLYDCWWMMGEGKVDYIPSGSLYNYNDAYCTICDKVYFDKKIQEKYPDGIPYSKLYEFMKTNKIPNKDESYLFYFYGLNSVDVVRNDLLKSGYDIYADKINVSKEQVIVTSIIKSGVGDLVPIGTTGTLAFAGKTAGIMVVTKILSTTGAAAGTVILPVGGTAVGGAIGVGVGVGVGWLVSSGLESLKDVSYTTPVYTEFKQEDLDRILHCVEYVSEG